MRKILLSLLLVTGGVFAGHAQRGSCGDNVKWSLSGETLTISGEGDMSAFSESTRPSWFPYESQIKHVVIEPGVTSIGAFTFYQNKTIQDVKLSEGLITIGQMAFYQCTVLNSVNFPESLDEFYGGWDMGYNRGYGYTFSGCSSLTEVTIPASLTKTGYGTFKNCGNLRKVNWNAESASTAAFRDMEIFRDCPVNKVTFGATVRVVPEFLFQWVSNLTKVETSGTIEYIGAGAFTGTGWMDIQNQSGTGCLYVDKALYSYRGNPNYAFEVDVPEGITGITGYAFNNLRYLVKISIPESMKTVATEAFNGCTSLGSVQWNAIDGYCAGAFQNCAIYEFNFGPKVRYIREKLLQGCNQLEEVVLPESLEDIGPGSFDGCSGLRNLTVPNSVTSIAWDVFKHCKFETVTFGTDLRWMGSGFDARKVVWNVRNLDYDWDTNPKLRNCGSLEELVIGNSVEVVPPRLCTSVANLKKLTIGENVKSIGESAFYGTGLTNVTIPEGVEEIGDGCFSATGIKKVAIPASVKTSKFFRGHKLENVVLLGDSLLNSWDFSFEDSPTVYVKNMKVYGNDWGWNRYNVVPLLNEGDAIPSFDYDGKSHKLSEHYAPQCNIPEHEIEVGDVETEVLPGKYKYAIPVTVSGEMNFTYNNAVSYVVVPDEATIGARGEISELLTKIDALVEEMTVGDNSWKQVELNAGLMDSNAKCEIEGSDRFTSWNVLFDSEDDDRQAFESTGNATQFHSDYSGKDTSDGLDHYISVTLPEEVRMSSFRFNYVTRWSEPAHCPTSMSVMASTSEDDDVWECIYSNETSLPTEAKSRFQSEAIPTYADYRRFRFMVHDNTSWQYFAGHAIFVMASFGMEFTENRSEILQKFDNEYARTLLMNVRAVELDAFRLLRNEHNVYDDCRQMISELSTCRDKLYSLIHELSGIIEISDSGSEAEEPVYDLAGRRVSRPVERGVYISNGRKFIK